MTELRCEELMDEIRIWTCENGHVMGLAGRNGSGQTQLMVYRLALDMSVEEPDPPEVMAVVEGYVFDIRCSVCDAVRTWVPGEAALRRLLESRGPASHDAGTALRRHDAASA